MTYQQARDAEDLNHLNDAITLFISRYLANLSTTNRKTIILFPGGMGSQLFRASTPQQNGPPYSYNLVWLDCSVLFGSATHLQMHGDIDLNDQIIIPDGPVEFPSPPPYDGFIVWCDQKQIDYLIFGWDWRRDLSFTTDFFLNTFMPLFEKRVKNLTPNPLQNLSLVGHSEGGMLLKLIINRSNNKYVQLLKRAVTVASPFYGYAGQLPRYFIGDPDLNALYGNQTVTRIVSSLAGGYGLLFLDQATFARDQAKLTQDPYYPASKQYPILDAITGVPADPYNPQTNGKLVRYPQNYGFDPQMLGEGKTIYDQVAAPLDQSVIGKFFNIRGVTTTYQGADINKTVTHQTWGWIDPHFDPNNTAGCPITDYLGPGDGTLPAWSTRFAQTPNANVHTVHGHQIEHMSMMSDSQVLGKLATVIGMAGKSKRPSDSGQPPLASRRELNRFLAGIAELRERMKDRTPAEQEQALRAYVVENASREKQRRLFARAFADALKSPSQKLGAAKAPAEPQGRDDGRNKRRVGRKTSRR